jgi:glycine/D-amino acid oxidase-like deaminating enzyme
MVNPAQLAWGLRAATQHLGVTIYENSPVTQLSRSGTGVQAVTPQGKITADKVVVATNAFPNPVRSARRSIIPVYDHVLMTEPLSSAQMTSIGWEGRQGMADAGNQFHYYRLTADNRILWGGWDALYHFNNGMKPGAEHNPNTSNLLAQHFFTTFPQLEGLNFTHQWAGPIGTTTRFSCAWDTSHQGRVAWAAGYTGMGVGASRFGAQVALDLVDGQTTERTELKMVRKRPVPFPPEPVRWLGVQATRAALQRSDRRQGRRGPWLKTLDKFGIGFNS